MNGFRRKLNRELDRIVRNMPSEFPLHRKKNPGQPEKTPLRRAPWVRWASAVAACAVLLAVIFAGSRCGRVRPSPEQAA